MPLISDEHAALHEAGHAVVHYRLSIHQAWVSIGPAGARTGDGSLTAGHTVGEGAEHVTDPVRAGDQVLAYYGGYAALVAAGYDETRASMGAADDFAMAAYLIDAWRIGEESEWKLKALELMRHADNVSAVARVANELQVERQLFADQVAMLVELADGRWTEEQYQQVKRLRWNGRLAD